jgi:translocation and assembly module TamA
MRKVIGEPLTPELLDRIEKWVEDRLGELGHACPKIRSQANSETGEVVVRVETGSVQTFLGVTEEPIRGTNPGVLQRYNAFQLGQVFDSSLLTVTENRVTQSRIVQSTYLSSHCIEDGVYLHHNLIPGPPRLITTGFGVNTEGLLLGRATWRNTRLGSQGSLIDVTAYASARRQSLSTTLNWYFQEEVSRLFLSPQAAIIHRNEQQFEDISANAKIGPATTVEYTKLGMSIFAGPAVEFFRTLRGSGAGTSRLVSLETRMGLQNHGYERYLNDPRTGYSVNLITNFNGRRLLSDVTAQRLNLRGEFLWNWRELDPPLWIFGVRTGVSAVLTDSSRSDIPASLLQYLGGSANIRGFGRLELPVDAGGGGLTSTYLGVEARLSNTLPYGLDPFVFFDVGAIGLESAQLNSPLYWSPGIGLRWASPVGPLRTTLAHGFSGSTPEHLQFYLSLGEEF